MASSLHPALPGSAPQHLHLIRRQLDYMAGPAMGLRWDPVKDAHTRFLLNIPYCYDVLRWQVEYQRLWDTWVPDFILDGEINPLLSQLPAAQGITRCLKNWDLADQQQLAGIVDGIIQHFRELQTQLIQQAAAADSRLQFELDTAVAGAPRLDLLYQEAGNGQPAKALFLVGLEGISLRCLHYLIAKALPAGELERMQQQLYLKVTYLVGSGSPPQTSLHMPRHLQDLIGLPQLPAWGDGNSLLQFLPEATEAMQQHCVRAAVAADLRWRLLSELSETKLGPAVEMDQAAARSALFRIAHNGGITSLFIDIPTSFPQDPPCLTLQSSLDGGGHSEECLQQYPWSPRWEPKEMAKRIYGVVKDSLPKKQKEQRPQSAGGASPPLM